MRKVSRIIGTILILVMLISQATVTVNAEVWVFGSEGPNKNPFTPRGYLVETDKGTHWLSSGYDNNSAVIRYTGVRNGVDYLEAKKEDGSNYTFYAMTDRNPWTEKTSWVAYGKKFFFAYKNGRRISNFNDYIQTPARRGDKVDPSGEGTCWVFPIEGFELEPGCLYEFGFQRGMQANNGITLVLAEDEEERIVGYIRQIEGGGGLSAAELRKYNEEKYLEYEFISSWYLNDDGIGYTVNQVPMRFSVQTYAELKKWEEGSVPAREFLASVKEQDYKEGKYKRENIEHLKTLIEQYDKRAEDEIKLMLQTVADSHMRNMVNEVNAMLEKAKSDKPEPADLSELNKLIAEGEALYAKASVNVGNDIGQYGKIEVDNLKAEIAAAKKLDEFYPQSEINAQVESLRDAIVEVKASKVMQEQMIFYDKVTGIYVIAPAGSLPEDATLTARRMGEETDDYKNAASKLSEEETEAVFYRIQFYQGDRKIQPTENVEVQMPIDMEISEKTSNIYSVSKNGELTKLASAKSNGMIYFESKVLEAFVLAGGPATEDEKAAAREQQMRDQMKQKDDSEADDKETKIEEKKKKKEEAKDPVDKILKRNMNNATFSNDVQRETNPVYLIYVAAVLALAAVILGIRGIIESRRKK